MTPSKGQQVSLFLRYGINIEGVVMHWNDDQIVLQTSNDFAIIYNPTDDLIMTKIVGAPIEQPKSNNVGGHLPDHLAVLGMDKMKPYIPPKETNDLHSVKERTIDIRKPEPHIEKTVAEKPQEKRAALEQEFIETYEEPSFDPKNLRLQKLAKLRSMMNETDRQIVANQLKDHTTILGATKSVYGNQISIFKRSV